MNKINLAPGQIKVTGNATQITATLGSSVAVCMYDPIKKVGGVCHYTIPEPKNGENPSFKKKNLYGKFALQKLLDQMKSSGASTERLESHVIGGCTDIDSRSDFARKDFDENMVNLSNIKLATRFLSDLKIRIVSRAIGGTQERKIDFYTETGEIVVEKLPRKNSKKPSVASKTKPKVSRRVEESNGDKINKKIQVMIVDDSKALRIVLKKMISIFPDMEIIHEAASALEAEELIKKKRPDVITLDVNMDNVDGVTFLKKIMKSSPIPTIMISVLDLSESGPIFEALDAGAFDYIKKPSLEEIDDLASDLHKKIRSAYSSHYLAKTRVEKNLVKTVSKEFINLSDEYLKRHLIAIGSSTGGTEALNVILSKLPKNIPPIIITQHMPPVFSKTLAQRLDNLCDFEVKEAEDGDELIPGRAILAQGGVHLKVELDEKNRMFVRLTEDPLVNRFRPSIDYMFDSIPVEICKKVLAFVLTGMGADGARGLLRLRQNGATTIAQDEQTSIVFGMPKEAQKMGGAEKVLALHDMPNFIAKFLNAKRKK